MTRRAGLSGGAWGSGPAAITEHAGVVGGGLIHEDGVRWRSRADGVEEILAGGDGVLEVAFEEGAGGENVGAVGEEVAAVRKEGCGGRRRICGRAEARFSAMCASPARWGQTSAREFALRGEVGSVVAEEARQKMERATQRSRDQAVCSWWV